MSKMKKRTEHWGRRAESVDVVIGHDELKLIMHTRTNLQQASEFQEINLL